MRHYEIRVDGEKFRTDDLTLADAAWIEGETGQSWLVMEPLLSARTCQAIMVRFLVAYRGRDEQSARELVGDMRLDSLLDLIEAVDEDTPDSYVDGLPKAGDEPEMIGSSGSSTTGDGRPTSPVDSPSVTSS